MQKKTGLMPVFKMAPGHGFSSAVGDNESRTDEDAL